MILFAYMTYLLYIILNKKCSQFSKTKLVCFTTFKKFAVNFKQQNQKKNYVNRFAMLSVLCIEVSLTLFKKFNL